MAITFDYATRLINVPQAEAAPILIQTLLNAIRAEEASERGITYPTTCTASGKDSLGGAVAVGITLSLLWSWKVSFASGAYQASVDGGNLSDALNRINNTGSPQVLVNASAAATIANGNGVSVPSAAENAAAVWTRAIEGALTAEQMQRILLAALAGKRQGLGTATEQYLAQNGTTPRITLSPDVNGNGAPTLNGAP